MKVKQKITNILLIIAFIAVCGPGNTKVFAMISNYIYYYITGVDPTVYTYCPMGSRGNTLEEKPSGTIWICVGDPLPSTDLAVCGACLYEDNVGWTCFKREAYKGECCIPSDCDLR